MTLFGKPLPTVPDHVPLNPNPYRRHTSPPTHFPKFAAICPVFPGLTSILPPFALCHTDGAARAIMGVSQGIRGIRIVADAA
jgi:hypothetical protein